MTVALKGVHRPRKRLVLASPPTCKRSGHPGVASAVAEEAAAVAAVAAEVAGATAAATAAAAAAAVTIE